MEHSVQAYLERMSTEKLLTFFQQFMQDWNDYDYIIPQILGILKARRCRVPDAIIDSWNRHLAEKMLPFSNK